MTSDDQPYCGAELLPHATYPDGSPVPTVCTRPLHGRDIRHRDEEGIHFWQWQDADGNFVPPPTGQDPEE